MTTMMFRRIQLVTCLLKPSRVMCSLVLLGNPIRTSKPHQALVPAVSQQYTILSNEILYILSMKCHQIMVFIVILFDWIVVGNLSIFFSKTNLILLCFIIKDRTWYSLNVKSGKRQTLWWQLTTRGGGRGATPNAYFIEAKTSVYDYYTVQYPSMLLGDSSTRGVFNISVPFAHDSHSDNGARFQEQSVDSRPHLVMATPAAKALVGIPLDQRNPVVETLCKLPAGASSKNLILMTMTDNVCLLGTSDGIYTCVFAKSNIATKGLSI